MCYLSTVFMTRRRHYGLARAVSIAKVKQAAVDNAINWVTGFVHSETDWHADKFAQSVKTATGADVKLIIHIANMDDIKIAMIERNASLITNIADDTRQKIVQAVINASVNKKGMRS